METSDETPLFTCANCAESFSDDFSFCPHCGQKAKIPRLSTRSIVKGTWRQLTHFDLRWWNTLKALFVPGKLTLAFWRGQHKKYWMPWRFLFLMTLITATLRWIMPDHKPEATWRYSDFDRNLHQEYYRMQFDSIAQSVTTGRADSAEIAAALALVKMHWNTAPSGLWEWKDSLTMPLLFFNSSDTFRLAIKDIYENSNAALSQKYHLGQWQSKSASAMFTLNGIAFEQFYNTFFNKNMLWFLLLAAVSTAFLLKLFFRKFNLAEHLIFSFHWFSFIIFIQAVVLDLLIPENWNNLQLFAGALSIVVYGYLAIRRCYAAGHWSAVWKSIVLTLLIILTLVIWAGAFMVAAVYTSG